MGIDAIYLDHHSTTPCDPRVVESMLPYFTEIYGNPASIVHVQGRRASNAVEEARFAIAKSWGLVPTELYFTAGATESNNIALQLLRPGDHLVTTAMEHKSILVPAERLKERGVEVTVVAPDAEGFVSAGAIAAALRPETRLVSVVAASGEIGTIEPVEEIGRLCRERGILFHTDATQAIGKIPFTPGALPIDLLSASAHKIYGPKGIGALVVRRGVKAEPLVTGGGQERHLRAGTVNVPGVIGFAAALALREGEMAEEAERLTAIRNELWDRIVAEIPGASVHGPRSLRLPGNLNISFAGVEAEALILAMRRFSFSSGSACSTGERGPSPILKAIGAVGASETGSIRIGLGKSNSRDQIEPLAGDLRRAVVRLRELSAPS